MLIELFALDSVVNPDKISKFTDIAYQLSDDKWMVKGYKLNWVCFLFDAGITQAQFHVCGSDSIPWLEAA